MLAGLGPPRRGCGGRGRQAPCADRRGRGTALPARQGRINLPDTARGTQPVVEDRPIGPGRLGKQFDGVRLRCLAGCADELRGSSISGGEAHQLKKGDVIIVPVGVPHWFKEVSNPFLYYVVKAR